MGILKVFELSCKLFLLGSSASIAPVLMTSFSNDDPSGALIPSTTWYSQLYRVEPRYME